MAMQNFICVQCGTQFAESAQPPSHCPICEDERQFVRHGGQEWTTLKMGGQALRLPTIGLATDAVALQSGVSCANQLIYNARQSNRSWLAHQSGCES